MSARDGGAARSDTIEIVEGPEGLCIYVNDYRVAGPKPWGGGTTIKRWDVPVGEIRTRLKRAARARAAAEG